ncbi:hypothetical protein I4F81_011836 [Pyropia yezoensis]|uniref:Uncharacterized protein n=1 Tax=Pyropia yezoensis TaxID=2788 RepID=A0ACC3CGE7_PYRYE|nr:hypothetical protein I4F81_011836 [Neopyropia yezoensis]
MEDPVCAVWASVGSSRGSPRCLCIYVCRDDGACPPPAHLHEAVCPQMRRRVKRRPRCLRRNPPHRRRPTWDTPPPSHCPVPRVAVMGDSGRGGGRIRRCRCCLCRRCRRCCRCCPLCIPRAAPEADAASWPGMAGGTAEPVDAHEASPAWPCGWSAAAAVAAAAASAAAAEAAATAAVVRWLAHPPPPPTTPGSPRGAVAAPARGRPPIAAAVGTASAIANAAAAAATAPPRRRRAGRRRACHTHGEMAAVSPLPPTPPSASLPAPPGSAIPPSPPPPPPPHPFPFSTIFLSTLPRQEFPMRTIVIPNHGSGRAGEAGRQGGGGGAAPH